MRWPLKASAVLCSAAMISSFNSPVCAQTMPKNQDLVLEKETQEHAETAFPGNIFSHNEALITQTEWLIERVAKGKSVRAVHDPESQYRHDLVLLGEQASQAAQAMSETNPDQAKILAKAARDLRTQVINLAAEKDSDAVERWLVSTRETLGSISVLRKKPAR